jgi:hypothetical protein
MMKPRRKGETNMARQKQHVFSARTTEQGLRLLNGLRREKGIGWDELVIDGMCAHYSLDKTVLSLPKKEAPAGEQQATQEPAKAAEGGNAKRKKASKKEKKVELGQ